MRALALPILLSAMALFSTTSIANAEPTASIGGGATTIRLSRAFLTTLATSGFQISKVEESTTNRNSIICPVIEGILDQADARGEIQHSGGIRFSKNRTIVRLANFTIDTGATSQVDDGANPPENGVSAPVVTADVVVNNSYVSRQPIFNAVLPDLTLPLPNGLRSLSIRPIALTLTSEGANVLNEAFKSSVFVADSSVGRASTLLTFGRSNQRTVRSELGLGDR
jgi:hypothetical protein